MGLIRMSRLAFIGFLLLGTPSISPRAAEIRQLPNLDNGVAIISVSGDFEIGDEQKFIRLSLEIDRAVVIFNSPGGNIRAGLAIGRAIRLKEFFTWASKDSTCDSVCGLAWLAGARRFMERDARVGFHAAYKLESAQAIESGQANALVGAYLNQLGLTQSVIAYVTEASPTDMKFLTSETTAQLGIEVTIVDEASPTTELPNSKISSKEA